jgi:hypothetical protein
MDQLQLSEESRQAYSRMVTAAIQLSMRRALMADAEAFRAADSYAPLEAVAIADSETSSEQLAESLAQLLERLASEPPAP